MSFVRDERGRSTNYVQDLKLKYYDLMIQHALHYNSYLDVAKYYYKVWETPSIKSDVNGKGRTVSCTTA